MTATPKKIFSTIFPYLRKKIRDISAEGYATGDLKIFLRSSEFITRKSNADYFCDGLAMISKDGMSRTIIYVAKDVPFDRQCLILSHELTHYWQYKTEFDKVLQLQGESWDDDPLEAEAVRESHLSERRRRYWLKKRKTVV